MNFFRKTILMCAVILTTLMIGLSIVGQRVLRHPLPVLGKVSDFTLYDSDAREFSLNKLNGKVFVTDFIFTTCGSICPLMSQNMASVYRSFIAHNDARFVSITVNPEYDSPEILTQYARRYRADTQKWYFLTGSRATIENLAIKSFKLGSVKEPLFHSGYFVLVDKKSQIRGYYEGTQTTEIRRLLADIARLLVENGNGPS